MKYIKGRGAQINTDNPFDQYTESKDIFFELPIHHQNEKLKTEYIDVHPKTILNKVDSPDIPSGYSMNPYQGCEHGCVYCYARNTHTYWGYSAGLDFESKILVKHEAPKLLEKRLKSKKWKADTIMLSGNTDCYQPVEQKLKITRSLLEIFWKYRHPVGIITKNNLITRDIDILGLLASKNLVHVAISINSLNESLRQKLEPRTSTSAQRIGAIKALSSVGVPVSVMIAPVIPGLTDHEIFDIAEVTADAGARNINHIVVRLNGKIDEIFTDWITKNFPDRKDKVLNHIKSVHGGKLNDSRFKTRMRGEGQIADIIADQVKLARARFFKNRDIPPYNLELHEHYKTDQLRLF